MKRIFRKLRRNRRLQQRHQQSETPMFERLEPRLLLSADIQGLLAGLQPIDPLDANLPPDAIEVDLTTLAANASAYTAQSLPYTQNFDAGLPTDVQGWEYY